MTSRHRRAIGIFPNRPKTASALQALNDEGFAMKNVSVIARDADREKAIAGVDVEDEVTNRSETVGTAGVVAGGVLGGVAGLLVGLGTLTIPGIGPALLAGEAATALTTVLGGAAGAVAGGLVGGLVGMGIPEHRAKQYRDRVASGDYLVMLTDTDPEIARAERTLKAAGIEDWGVYDPPQDTTRSADTDSHREVAVSPGRSNDYNRVDHPMDQGYRDRVEEDGSIRTAGLPHRSNPVEVDNPDAARATSDIERRALGIFKQRHQMEEALAQLRQTGFPMHTLSIAVRETEADSLNTRQGHSLSGAARLTSGLDHLDLPNLGSVLVMGPDSSVIADAADRDRSRGITEILESLGIAPESASLYGRYLSEGAYLVTLRGHHQNLTQAASTLSNYGMHDWGIYDVWRS